MFILLVVKDTVPVAPKAFSIPPAITIQDSLNRKYANKLIPDRGLALSAFDILTAEDGKATWGNGLMYYKVSFRLMLFAPFVGQVIVGKVFSTSKTYIRGEFISLGFFRDIYIVPSLLPPNSAFDPVQQQFFWYSDDDDSERIFTTAELLDTEAPSRLYIDDGEAIRFRVDSVEWQDVRPLPASQSAYGDAAANGDDAGVPRMDPIERAGYKIFVSGAAMSATIAESGLGVVSWWNAAEGVEGDMKE
ncbi:MAG: DNA-directed RNA polymerase III subunit rpc25 [Tremellales sp. Tagirdzhanova-0007]|nr:MAG: DNA-directed RNA polymerase III subunit rpc25 [Tremellales sp. Tagirdzhanova-0007]